ncbi:MAG: hypothetical protein NZ693_06665 [Thermoflexales bacterium]|nr:hypothetical protein [Thermoflexales bacterium]
MLKVEIGDGAGQRGDGADTDLPRPEIAQRAMQEPVMSFVQTISLVWRLSLMWMKRKQKTEIWYISRRSI